jgi:hypothetical protein
MSFAGHVFDMISRSNQNLAMIKSRREKIRRIRKEYLKSIPGDKVFAPDTQIPKEQLAEIKAGIRKKLAREAFIYRICSGFILLIITSVAVYYLTKYL